MKFRFKSKIKSQVTIFLILGLIMVMVVITLTIVSRYAVKKASKQETIDIKEAAIDVHPVKNFVIECLSSTSKNGLNLLGQQGGYIFKSQGGALIDYADTDEGIFFARNGNTKVVYNILKPRFPVGKNFPTIPDYPWKIFPYSDKIKNIKTFESKGAFGSNNLPPLNQSFGQNSMRQQLAAFTENSIDKCLDFSIFEGQGMSITKGKKEVRVDINENDITFTLDYDMAVENLVSGEKTGINGFSVRHKLRLGKMHRFINSLIESDISDINFNIINNTAENSFQVDIRKDIYNNDDLIIITDAQSMLGSLPYKYYFARKNRSPALFYLSPEEITLPAFNDEGAFTAVTEETLLGKQKLMAIDPDEDSITNNSFSITPKPPITLLFPRIEFKAAATDGSLEDYQIITVLRG